VRLHKFYETLGIKKPDIQLYSCSTATTFPDDPVSICELVAAQWASPVRFRQTIEAMYQNGVRIFVEVGPRHNLTAFVDDILRGKPHLAVPSNMPHRSGITQLNHLVGWLAAHHVPMQLDYLYQRRAPERLQWEKLGKPSAQSGHGSGLMRLATGLQPLRLTRTSPGPDMAKPVFGLAPSRLTSSAVADGNGSNENPE